MKLSQYFKIIVACVTCMAVTSCSLFSSSRQNVRIETNDPDCVIKVDGMTVGHGETAIANLKKNKSHIIVAQNGSKKGMAVVESELSTTGVLDIVGGILFLVPFIGFCSKGAWELDPDVVVVDVN